LGGIRIGADKQAAEKQAGGVLHISR
jgi:hypothetical protein